MKEICYFNTVGILTLIRDGKANDWESLCRVCGWPPYPIETVQLGLVDSLDSLRSEELISVKGLADDQRLIDCRNWGEKEPFKNITLEVTNRVHSLQVSLGISLKEIAKLSSHSSLIVKPRFGKPKSINIDILVLMPFLESFLTVYQDHIMKVGADLGLSIKHADDFFSEKAIIQDIWDAINSAKVIVADCTERNPNVFYEIGIAHVVGKPVIFITREKMDVPFDIGHLRYIQYDYTPRGMKAFENDLEIAIKRILDQHVNTD